MRHDNEEGGSEAKKKLAASSRVLCGSLRQQIELENLLQPFIFSRIRNSSRSCCIKTLQPLSHTTPWQVSLPSPGQCPISVFSSGENPSQLEAGVQYCIRVIGPPALQHFWHSPLLGRYTTTAPKKRTNKPTNMIISVCCITLGRWLND